MWNPHNTPGLFNRESVAVHVVSAHPLKCAWLLVSVNPGSVRAARSDTCSVVPAHLQDALPVLPSHWASGTVSTGLRNNTSCLFTQVCRQGALFCLSSVDCELNSRLASISYKQHEHITPFPLGPQRRWGIKCCSCTWTSHHHDFSLGLCEASQWGSEVWTSGLHSRGFPEVHWKAPLAMQPMMQPLLYFHTQCLPELY